MRFLFVIDPLDSLNLQTETSLLLMEEAARRGHESRVCTVGDLYLAGSEARARSREIRLDFNRRPFYALGEPHDTGFDFFDVALMRKDPPVDDAYLMATFVLERAAAATAVVNDPLSLRTVNEKLLPLEYPAFVPPTLVTSDPDRVAAFVGRQGRSILKPLNDCSGRGIKILAAAAEAPAGFEGRFVMVQKFIDAVVEGDKRLFLLEGAILGAVNRIPRGADRLANIHQGAEVAGATITERDREIVSAIAPMLVRRGLWMAGIDVIGGYLTEINVTSPSAVRQINAVSGTHIERPLVDFLESIARRRREAAPALPSGRPVS